MFALVRAGLPNTIVVLALAALPLAALAVTPDQSTQRVYSQGAAPVIIAGPDRQMAE
jgi:hypothetical protein